MSTMTMTQSAHKETVFVKSLRRMMDEGNVLQMDIARTLNVVPGYVNDVVHGRRAPFTPEQCHKLQQAYGFDLEELLIHRAWVTRKIDIPLTATFQQVKDAVKQMTWRRVQVYEEVKEQKGGRK